ncbi:hypothetical protein IEQ34_001626 [Dendrobium chrysotoxum]|uniref:Transmembrane protein n=1 Tax=Dendrobium chrysotoxum TaxID=161865 RepID=A0AAV7HPR8_DENCH|nr:hypothetical protein IEQ34_001626 [Dendrobium chrysotoxum]
MSSSVKSNDPSTASYCYIQNSQIKLFEQENKNQTQKRQQKIVVVVIRQLRVSQSSLLVIFFFFLFIILTLIISCSILILLVFRHQIIHITLCLSELHFIHAFAGVPVQKRLPAKHRRELLAHTTKHLLNRC